MVDILCVATHHRAISIVHCNIYKLVSHIVPVVSVPVVSNRSSICTSSISTIVPVVLVPVPVVFVPVVLVLVPVVLVLVPVVSALVVFHCSVSHLLVVLIVLRSVF